MNQFDPNIPNYLEGSVTGVAIMAPATFPAPALPNRVVDPKQEFTLRINWEIYGALVPLWLAALDNNWRIEVFAESMGGGEEIRIGSASKAKGDSTACGTGTNCRQWEVDVKVPANTLKEGNPGGAPDSPSGIYKLAASVFLNSSLPGAPGFDLVGFHEGPIIQVESLQ